MATEKTPAYKRIKRAETGREDWKVKAIERREEIERLKITFKENLFKTNSLSIKNDELKSCLNQANDKIAELEKTIVALKKNRLKNL